MSQSRVLLFGSPKTLESKELQDLKTQLEAQSCEVVATPTPKSLAGPQKFNFYVFCNVGGIPPVLDLWKSYILEHAASTQLLAFCKGDLPPHYSKAFDFSKNFAFSQGSEILKAIGGTSEKKSVKLPPPPKTSVGKVENNKAPKKKDLVFDELGLEFSENLNIAEMLPEEKEDGLNPDLFFEDDEATNTGVQLAEDIKKEPELSSADGEISFDDDALNDSIESDGSIKIGELRESGDSSEDPSLLSPAESSSIKLGQQEDTASSDLETSLDDLMDHVEGSESDSSVKLAPDSDDDEDSVHISLDEENEESLLQEEGAADEIRLDSNQSEVEDASAILEAEDSSIDEIDFLEDESVNSEQGTEMVDSAKLKSGDAPASILDNEDLSQSSAEPVADLSSSPLSMDESSSLSFDRSDDEVGAFDAEELEASVDFSADQKKSEDTMVRESAILDSDSADEEEEELHDLPDLSGSAQSLFADSNDIGVIKKYAALKEREAREKQATIDILRGEIKKLTEKLKSSDAERRKISLQVEDLRAEVRALEDTRDQQKHLLSKSDEKNNASVKDMQIRLENAQYQAKRAEAKLVEFKERVRMDIQKIRVRERELGNRLELQKKDAQALLRSKDHQLLEQKREVDRLQYEIELLRERIIEETEKAEERTAKLYRAIQSLKMAQGMLSGLGEEVIQTEVSDNDDDEEAA